MKVFTKEIRDAWFNHAPKYQERIKKQLKDNKFILDVMFKHKDKIKINDKPIMDL